MNIIITGGAGFIGSNLALKLQEDHNIIVIDNFYTGTYSNLRDFKGIVLCEDINTIDWQTLYNRFKFEIVLHEAAITDTRVLDEKTVIQTNVNAFKKLLDFACSKKIKIIYASSAAVYGNGISPMKETQKLIPLNVYGFSKMQMDILSSTYASLYPDMVIIGLRYFNVFGPNEYHKIGYCSMIHQLFQQMRKGIAPKIFFDGNQTRDHIYVKDVVKANILSLNYQKSGIFNVGTGIETSFNSIITILNSQLNMNMTPNFIENPYTFFQDHTCADINNITNEMNFKPDYSIKDSIAEYVKLLKKLY